MTTANINLWEEYIPPLTPEEVLQAAQEGDWDLVSDALLGFTFEATFLNAGDEEYLLSVMESARSWDALADLVACQYLFDTKRMEDIILQALYDQHYPCVIRLVLELKVEVSNNVLITILEKFLEEEDLLFDALRLIGRISSSNEDLDWLEALWSSAAQRPTRNWQQMQEVLTALHRLMYPWG